ncbi:iron(III) transport system substrate-binding protein [Rhizobiales bacterium GAS191]|jgi:iron(III) transport system substrate-binding protein|nr:iron(III) transport system substrate-binding protein [Rhizobiales bacterium GAS191]
MRQRNLALAALALLGTAFFSGMTGAQAQKLVIYSANDSTLNDLVFDAFTKETGIKVESVSTGSGVLMKRIQAEKDNPQGDIIWGVSRSLLQTNKGYFAPYKSKENAAIPADFLDPDNLWTGTNVHILVVTQNTKLIPAGEGPKSWSDLVDPKYKGRIAFTDPANSGSAYTNATLLVDHWGGEAGWDKLKALFANTKILNRSTLVFQGVGNGEYGLGMSLEYAGALWASNGAPVTNIYPADGTLALMEGVAILKGDPNPDAAKAFVDYINRKDVCEMMLKATFRRPARQDLDFAHLPGNMPALSSLKLLAYDEDGWTAKRPQTLEKLKGIIQDTR